MPHLYSPAFPFLKCCGLAAIVSAGPALAGTSPGKAPQPVSPPLSPWEVTAAAGLGYASGNTDHLNLSAQFLATYLNGPDEFYFGTDYYRTETDGAVTGNSLHAFTAYNRTLAGPFYVGILADGWYDEMADLDYRIGLTPTLGFHLIKDETTLLALEGGIGYQWEKQGGLRDDFTTARFAERFSHKFAGGVSLVQSVSWTTELEDFSENWFLVAEAGLKVPLSGHWALGTAVRYTYDNTPAAGLKSDDLALLATLNYSLRGFAPEAVAGRRTLKAEKVKAADPDMGWTNSAAAGFSLTSGNADNLLLSVDYASAYRSPEQEVLLGLGGAYGETDSDTTAQNLRAAGQYNKLLGTTWYAGGGLGYLYDDPAEVDYRISPFGALGAYLVKTASTKLSLEAGPAYVWEKVGGLATDYFAIQAAQKLSLALTDTVSLTEAVVYSTEAADFDNYTLTAIAAVDVDMTANLSFRTGVSVVYDSTPAGGLDSTDVTVTAGVAVKF